jgi:hypothetical protein
MPGTPTHSRWRSFSVLSRKSCQLARSALSASLDAASHALVSISNTNAIVDGGRSAQQGWDCNGRKSVEPKTWELYAHCLTQPHYGTASEAEHAMGDTGDGTPYIGT